ncbi:MAG: hypothetical protein ACP5U2_16615 [Bryobacteraceae bacterium]
MARTVRWSGTSRCGGFFGLLALSLACWGQPQISAVLNGTSYSAAISPGCWVAIFAERLARKEARADKVPLPRSLGGVSVTVDRVRAPLFFVSPRQVNTLIPFELDVPRIRFVKVVVTSEEDNSVSAPYAVWVTPTAPGLFTLSGTGTGTDHVYDADFRQVSKIGNGDTVLLYAAGLGATDPPAMSDSGEASQEPLNRVATGLEV